MNLSGVENIFRTFDQASETDINEGLQAYSRYNAVCAQIASFYGYTLEKTAAVFAATSPNNDYVGNLRSTVSVLSGHRAGLPVERIRVSCYNHCRDRAFSYLDGIDFLATTTGEKIRNFYRCIIKPGDPVSVCIDGHAANIWNGKQRPLKQVVGTFKYKTVAEDFRTVARLCLLLPNQIQAIVWFAWKRIHNIFYFPPQLHLWIDRTGDFWRTKIDVRDIKPFEIYPAAESLIKTDKFLCDYCGQSKTINDLNKWAPKLNSLEIKNLCSVCLLNQPARNKNYA